MLRLRNLLLPLVRAGHQHPSPILLGDCRFLLSTSTSTTPFSLEDYLVASCGLAPAQARSASKKALAEASRRSVKACNEFASARHYPGFNPDAVLALLSRIGLSRADIADVVAADPLLLRSRVDILEPRLLALRDRLGLSVPQIARLLVVNSRTIRIYSDIGAKILFYINFFGSFEQLLVAMKRNNVLLTSNLDRVVKPNIALLCQCGLSVQDVAKLVSSRNTRLLTLNPERVKELVLRVEELGVPNGSWMVKHAVSAVAHTTKEATAAKLEFLESTLGCSKSEAATAVSKMPKVLGISEEILLRKIRFLIDDVGLEPQYILERPILFTFSLEKRLLPRHRVIKVLLAKGLLKTNLSFFTIAIAGEMTFRLKFIDCHKDFVNELEDAYSATTQAADYPQATELKILGIGQY